MKSIIFINLFIFLLLGCASGTKVKKTDASESRKNIRNERAYNHFLEGELYDFQDQYEKGLIEYYQSLLYDSSSAQIYKAIARDHMRLQQYSSAVEYLKRAHKLDPQEKEVLNYLGEAYYNLKEFPKAISYYEQLFALDPYNTSVQNNLIYLYSRLNQDNKLLDFYGKLTEYYPGDTDRAIQYAMTAIKQKKIDVAKQILNQVVEEDSTQLKARFVLGNLYEMQKDTAAAIRSYQKILAAEPDFEDALTHLYRIYRSKQDWEGLENTFLPIVNSDPDNAQARLILAEAYYYQDKQDKADDILATVLKDKEFRPAALEMRGRIAFEKENFDEAEKYFTMLTEEDPQNRFGWLFLAIINNQQEKYNNTISILRKALDIHGEDPDLLGLYGSTLNEVGKQEEALPVLEKAHQIKPDDINTTSSLAALYDQLKMWKKSDSLYETAIKKFPENALLLNNYSYSLSERGIQLNRALEMVRKALEIDSANGAYLDTMGWIYYQLGEYQNALQYIQKAMAEREDSAEVIEHLGDVYLKLGKPDEARKYWEKALGKNPENIDLKKKLQTL
jgi:tetratricopeptide (TPR) repeat protein